jgi:lipopolysaccharide export system protein LptC
MAAGPLPNYEPPGNAPSGPDTPGTGESSRLSWIKHRRLVTLLRIALPMAALLLAAIVIAWPKLQNRERSSFSLTPTHADPKEVEQLTMVNPRFVGLDTKQQPYTVTAKSATQDRPGADIIVLDHPQADILLESGSWVTVTGLKGRYAQKAQILDLAGNIEVFHDAGYEFHTERAQVDLANDTINGDVPVNGHGPGGTIDAQGFMILDHGQTVIFTGDSKLHLNPGAQGGAYGAKKNAGTPAPASNGPHSNGRAR